MASLLRKWNERGRENERETNFAFFFFFDDFESFSRLDFLSL